MARAGARPGLSLGRHEAGGLGHPPGLHAQPWPAKGRRLRASARPVARPGRPYAGLPGFLNFLFGDKNKYKTFDNYLLIAPKIANKISNCSEKQTLHVRIIEMIF